MAWNPKKTVEEEGERAKKGQAPSVALSGNSENNTIKAAARANAKSAAGYAGQVGPGTGKAADKFAAGNIGGGLSDYATLDVMRDDFKHYGKQLKGLLGKGIGGGGGAGDPIDFTATPGIASAPQLTNPTAFTGATIGAVNDPRAALIDMAAQNQFREQQMGLAGQLSAQAQGQGPSLATNMLRQGQEAANAATFAQLATQRGGPTAMGARTAMQTQSSLGAQVARDAANARIQEQLAAREQLAGVLQAGRTGDIGLATTQAQMQQEAGLAKYRGDLETAIHQGRLDQDTASQMFAAAQTQAQQNAQLTMQFEELRAKYAAMGLDAAKANQLAAMGVQGAKAQQQGNILNAAATVAGAYFGGPAGATAANTITQPQSTNTPTSSQKSAAADEGSRSEFGTGLDSK